MLQSINNKYYIKLLLISLTTSIFSTKSNSYELSLPSVQTHLQSIPQNQNYETNHNLDSNVNHSSQPIIISIPNSHHSSLGLLTRFLTKHYILSALTFLVIVAVVLLPTLNQYFDIFNKLGLSSLFNSSNTTTPSSNYTSSPSPLNSSSNYTSSPSPLNSSSNYTSSPSPLNSSSNYTSSPSPLNSSSNYTAHPSLLTNLTNLTLNTTLLSNITKNITPYFKNHTQSHSSLGSQSLSRALHKTNTVQLSSSLQQNSQSHSATISQSRIQSHTSDTSTSHPITQHSTTPSYSIERTIHKVIYQIKTFPTVCQHLFSYKSTVAYECLDTSRSDIFFAETICDKTQLSYMFMVGASFCGTFNAFLCYNSSGLCRDAQIFPNVTCYYNEASNTLCDQEISTKIININNHTSILFGMTTLSNKLFNYYNVLCMPIAINPYQDLMYILQGCFYLNGLIPSSIIPQFNDAIYDTRYYPNPDVFKFVYSTPFVTYAIADHLFFSFDRTTNLIGYYSVKPSRKYYGSIILITFNYLPSPLNTTMFGCAAYAKPCSSFINQKCFFQDELFLCSI